MRQFYVIRHCKAEGQAPEAPLTEDGRAQAVQMAAFLAPTGIQRIISSPFRRAVQSAEPLARRLGLPIEREERLVERVLAGVDLPDWMERLSESFAAPDLALEGGESGQEAQTRAVAAVMDALQQGPERTTAFITHGNLMTLLLQHFDNHYGFDQWVGLTNPDVYRITLEEKGGRVERVWEA